MDFKKRYVILIMFLSLFSTTVNSQSLVINEELLIQLQKNNIQRIITDTYVRNNIKKTNESYSKIEQHYAKIAIVKEAILKSLTNVENAMKNGKQVKDILKTLNLAIKEFNKLVKYDSLINFDFLIMKAKYVNKYKADMLDYILEMNQEVLKVKKGYLMDYQARQLFLDKIQSRVNQIYIRTKALSMLFDNYKRLNYLHRNATLSFYVNQDLNKFNSIITNLNSF